MSLGNAELEIAYRHVQERAAQIARQHELLAKLCVDNTVSMLAKQVLACLEASYILHKAYLKQLENSEHKLASCHKKALNNSRFLKLTWSDTKRTTLTSDFRSRTRMDLR